MEMHEVLTAIRAAESTLQKADNVTGMLLRLLVGRLRHTGEGYQDQQALKALKRELRDYNISTGMWKNQ